MFCVTTPDDDAARLEARERGVRGVGHDVRADQRLGPALPDARRIAREHVDVTVDHRIEPLPEPAGRAEVGQAAGGRDARARERDHGRPALEEARQHAGIGVGGGGHASTVAAA